MLALFGCTVFLSAALLFTVQPMFGKMILPLFGGSPAVWLTALVFFQLMLLAGYAYVHVSGLWLSRRGQAVLHLVVLVFALAVLPIHVITGSTPLAPTEPLISVTSVLFSSMALPFFALSASAPLLQRWFSGTRHPAAADPYFLYAASNLGSLGGLLAYPVLVEPWLRLRTQSYVWTMGYVALAFLMAACAVLVWKSGSSPSPVDSLSGDSANLPAVPWPMRLRWLALAAVPSSLLLSVTGWITEDFAIPLLWVIPLAIYLATFVVTFARRPMVSPRTMARILPFAVIVPLIIVAGHLVEALGFIVFHLAALFVAAMVCHGELAASRPDARRLTEFYFWVSLGGAAGGLFNVLIAPLVFRTMAEYPLGLIASCLLMPSLAGRVLGANAETHRTRRQRGPSPRSAPARPDYALDAGLAIVGGTLVLGLELGGQLLKLPISSLRSAAFVFAVPFLITLRFRRQPRRFALVLAAVVAAALFYPDWGESVIARSRSFFGVYRIANRPTYRVLIHGTTDHGAQSLDPANRCTPLSYYFPTGPLGYLFRSFQGAQAKSDIAVVGLGTGSTAGYAKIGQRWTFFEIDPAIERIARDPRYFTFLRDCTSQARVVLGDGRLSLAREPDAAHDVIIFDAFNSDAIPVHLLTSEAVAMYLHKLTPRGVLAFHISNRYVDLRPVLSRVARDAGLVSYLRFEDVVSPAEKYAGKEPSAWVVMARDIADLGSLTQDTQWRPALKTVTGAAWTDDYSNVLRTLRYDALF